MTKIEEDTQSRLVLTVGSRYGNSTRYVLDKAPKLLTLERHAFIFKRKPVTLSFDDVADIGIISTGSWRNKQHTIVFRTKAGKRIWTSGEYTAEETVAALNRLRTFLGLPAAARAADAQVASPLFRWAMLGISGATVVLAALVGVGKYMELTELPGCSSDVTRDTLASIFRDADLELGSLSGAVETSRIESGRIECRARATFGDETLLVHYAIFEDAGAATVQVVRSTEMGVKPAKLVDVTEAANALLALASAPDRLPREEQDEVKQLLERLFDTSGIDEEVLDEEEVDRASAWFNAGHVIGAKYILAGTGADDFGEMPDDPALWAKSDQNVAAYPSEVGRYLDFEVHILAAMAKSDGQRQGEAAVDERGQILRSYLQAAMLTSLAHMTNAGVTDTWRSARAAALAAVADTARALLDEEQLAALREQAELIKASMAEEQLKKQLEDLAGRLKRS